MWICFTLYLNSKFDQPLQSFKEMPRDIHIVHNIRGNYDVTGAQLFFQVVWVGVPEKIQFDHVDVGFGGVGRYI